MNTCIFEQFQWLLFSDLSGPLNGNFCQVSFLVATQAFQTPTGARRRKSVRNPMGLVARPVITQFKISTPTRLVPGPNLLLLVNSGRGNQSILRLDWFPRPELTRTGNQSILRRELVAK